MEGDPQDPHAANHEVASGHPHCRANAIGAPVGVLKISPHRHELSECLKCGHVRLERFDVYGSSGLRPLRQKGLYLDLSWDGTILDQASRSRNTIGGSDTK
eukprot:5261385-Amphidinium_carterae.2